jgi:hypothetical protein
MSEWLRSSAQASAYDGSSKQAVELIYERRYRMEQSAWVQIPFHANQGVPGLRFCSVLQSRTRILQSRTRCGCARVPPPSALQLSNRGPQTVAIQQLFNARAPAAPAAAKKGARTLLETLDFSPRNARTLSPFFCDAQRSDPLWCHTPPRCEPAAARTSLDAPCA